MTTEFVRLSSPSIADFRRASALSETSTGSLKSLNCEERFAFFRQIGVELVLAKNEERLLGICFVWPVRYVIENETFNSVWLFQFATVEKDNIGTIMIYHMMDWYPSIMCVGVTEQAVKLYTALQWGVYEPVWRCVHPIALDQMIQNYEDRLSPGKLRWAKLAQPVYNPLMRLIERILALGTTCAQLEYDTTLSPPEVDPVQYPVDIRLNMMASYLDIFQVSDNESDLDAIAFGAVGRIVIRRGNGRTRLRQHAAIWSALRKKNISLCEIMATSEGEKQRNIRLGYIPISMPIYYWENTQKLASFFDQFHKANFNFLVTDKLL